MRPVTRLIVACERPDHLAEDEARAWLLREAGSLARSSGVERVELSALESARGEWDVGWDWLIEVQLADQTDGRTFVRQAAWVDLLGDLRLLGMRPTVAVVDPARTHVLASGH